MTMIKHTYKTGKQPRYIGIYRVDDKTNINVATENKLEHTIVLNQFAERIFFNVPNSAKFHSPKTLFPYIGPLTLS